TAATPQASSICTAERAPTASRCASHPAWSSIEHPSGARSPRVATGYVCVRMKVLVAHTEPEVRAAIGAALAAVEAEVVEADGLKTALEACREHQPQVAVVDLAASGRRGPERLLAAIKGDPDLFRISVVLLHEGDLDAAAALNAVRRGAEDLLRWPAAGAEVVAR